VTALTVPGLRQIYFYLTEGCNLACRHCWLAPRYDVDGSRFPSLSAELFEAAIREAIPLGLNRIKLTGGEPLLHPGFGRLLDIARREEVGLTLETNGLLCTPQVAAAISGFRDRFVSVSMDGADAATHEWVRGVAGSFAAAQQAVRNLVAAGTSPQIIMSVMRCNADQMGAVVRMAESLGAASVKFNVIQPTGRGERIREGTDGLDVADLIGLGRYVDRELSHTTRLPLIFDYPLAFRPLGSILRNNGSGVCGILGIVGVLADGRYALCGIGEHLPDLVFGMVGVDPLEQVWRSHPVLNALREGLPDRLEGICSRCLMRYRCLGSCVAQNYYRAGSLWAPFWFCEQAEKAGLFPSARLGMATMQG
jgi:SynChlorMet cassette radical SAM/SPASM protein ScmF